MSASSPRVLSDSVQLALTAVYIAIVVVSWGINYPLMKLALQDMPPLTFAAMRVLGGAATLACVLFLIKAPKILPSKRELLPLANVSVLQFASVLGFAGIALTTLPASRTITAIYSMPFWAAIFDMIIVRTRLRPIQLLGILISLGGMVLFIDPSVIDWNDSGAVIGLCFALAAGMLWGLGAVLYRSRSWSASLLSQSLWQLLVAGAVLSAAAIALEFPFIPNYTTTVTLILIWNWIIPTALAVWAWTKVLNRIPASIAGQLLMFTPFVGIAMSAWMFNEDLPPVFWVSTALIVLGGAMVLIRRPSSV